MRLLARLFAAVLLLSSVCAHANETRAGLVLMHGKGGAPNGYVAGLASALAKQGVLVANIEMPWSGARGYDVDTSAAEKEVLAALASLKQQGAGKVFVAGHSQGGVFALFVGSRNAVDGIIAIAPGGSSASPVYRDKLAEPLARARSLVQEGRGQEKNRFTDFESSRGNFPLLTTGANYLSWFDPEGAMNQVAAMRNIPAEVPVLYVVPTNDYPGLVGIKDMMFALLPKHPLTKLYEPNANHMGAPSASAQEMLQWISVVGQRQ